MSRVVQPQGTRGSLKWIQRFVNERPDFLDQVIRTNTKRTQTIEWLSPLAVDSHAEYRDADFLNLIGWARLSAALAEFWPLRGPQWDALARTTNGDVLLIEAKAHIDEICSPGTSAKENSRSQIAIALDRTIAACGAKPRVVWADTFYQLANRLAHLYFLRENGVAAWLVLVNFVGDSDVNGPETKAEWEAAYRVVYHVLDFKSSSPLWKYVLHVYPDVRVFS